MMLCPVGDTQKSQRGVGNWALLCSSGGSSEVGSPQLTLWKTAHKEDKQAAPRCHGGVKTSLLSIAPGPGRSLCLVSKSTKLSL